MVAEIGPDLDRIFPRSFILDNITRVIQQRNFKSQSVRRQRFSFEFKAELERLSIVSQTLQRRIVGQDRVLIFINEFIIRSNRHVFSAAHA